MGAAKHVHGRDEPGQRDAVNIFWREGVVGVHVGVENNLRHPKRKGEKHERVLVLPISPHDQNARNKCAIKPRVEHAELPSHGLPPSAKLPRSRRLPSNEHKTHFEYCKEKQLEKRDSGKRVEEGFKNDACSQIYKA